MRYIIIIILALAVTQSEAQITDSLSVKLLQQEMVYWQAPTDSVRLIALLNKAKIDRCAGLYENALNELYRTEKYNRGEATLAAINYEKMLNYFLSDQYALCSEVVLDSNAIALHYTEYMTMKLYAMNETEKWEKCKNELIKLSDKNDTSVLEKINQLPVAYKYKSPEKSRRLSAILPGLGEIYSGYPVKGITSFILNAGFLVFAYYNFATSYYVTGAISGIFPFIKFHAGGARLSTLLADEHNEKELGKLKDRYKKAIDSVIH